MEIDNEKKRKSQKSSQLAAKVQIELSISSCNTHLRLRVTFIRGEVSDLISDSYIIVSAFLEVTSA